MLNRRKNEKKVFGKNSSGFKHHAHLFRAIEKESLREIEKAYLFFTHKYPKFILLLISALVAYSLFSRPAVSNYLGGLGDWGYFGIFIAGLLFSFGFSTPFAIGIFFEISPPNIYLAAIIGGIGAFLADMLIFKFIRFSFMDEFNRFEHEHPIRQLEKAIKEHIGLKVRTYLLYFLAGFIIASPLPDEIGVTMLAGLTTMKSKFVGGVSFIFNTIGIFIVLLIATQI